MDEITLLRALAPEAESPEAVRADALCALEARFEHAPTAPARPVRPRRRGVLALAASAGGVAAIVTGVLLFSSGPSVEPAAAKVLHQTAAVAAADASNGSVPGAGQFLYARTKSVELQEWVPGSYTASLGGVTFAPGSDAALEQKKAFVAFVPWQEEIWMSADEPGRHRSVMGTPDFLSSSERARWEKAGSPPPSPFDASGVRDVQGRGVEAFRDLSALPAEPNALRLAIEQRQSSGTSGEGGISAASLDVGQAIAELWDVLDNPSATPALRAAAFGALAELPGIELNRDATDLAGRRGYALTYERQEPGGYGSSQQPGFRVEYIFDPETSEVLGKREVIADPERLSAEGIPAGTVKSEIAYLRSGIVGSTEETP